MPHLQLDLPYLKPRFQIAACAEITVTVQAAAKCPDLTTMSTGLRSSHFENYRAKPALIRAIIG